MLRRHHQGSCHLRDSDQHTTKDSRAIGFQVTDQEAWYDTEQCKRAQHKIEPVKDVVFYIVLLLDEVKVATRTVTVIILEFTYNAR